MTIVNDPTMKYSDKIARVLSIHEDILYIEMDGHIAYSTDCGNTWVNVVRLPRAVSGYGRLHRRLCRLGVHTCAVMPEGSLVFVAHKGIWCYDAATKSLAEVFRIRRGSRPLVLCHTVENRLYFGEYFNNPGRAPVHVYASTYPSLDFQPIFTFPAGTIRHVHGVFQDPFTNALWVTTGDIEKEAAIWRSDDQFATLRPMLIGRQQHRGVSLLFTADHVYFGSDTPCEQNYLCRFDRATGIVERLVAVQGSVFYGCKVGETLVFATAVEPSRINKTSQAFIWASRDGFRWHCIRGYHKDFWPPKLFQYGQILFPVGVNTSKHLWHTPLGTQFDQTIQRMDLEYLYKNI